MKLAAILSLMGTMMLGATTLAQSPGNVRDPISRKFQAEKGFFEPSKQAVRKPMPPRQGVFATSRLFRRSGR